MSKRKHPYDEAADRELARWPGVVVIDRATMPSGHRRLVLEYRGKRRFVVYPGTPRDNKRGPRNHVQDIRRVLRQIEETK